MEYLTDLRTWIKKLEEIGRLKRIHGANWNLEIGALWNIIGSRLDPPSALFDEIPGYPKDYRVLVNSQNSQRISALAQGMTEEESLLSPMDYVRALKMRLQRIKSHPVIPTTVLKEASFLENIREGDSIDMFEFPTPHWSELDGGRYIGTGCVCIIRDPETGYVNLGTYRVMIQDKQSLGLYMSPIRNGTTIMRKYHSAGKSMPIAITFGQDLITYWAAVHLEPYGRSEYEYAAGVRGAPIDVINGFRTGLPIPASAEIVVEGEVEPNDVREEGPLAEWVGYYSSGRKPEPLIRVRSVMFRKNPIIFGHPELRAEVVGMPWAKSAYVWNKLEECGVPDIKGVWSYGQLMTLIAIQQRYPGHARQAALLATQLKEGSIGSRYTIIVDEDIELTDIQQVLWAIATRSNPSEDIEIIRRNWSSPIDPMVPKGTPKENCFSSRAIIDACKPYEWKEEFPPSTGPSQELRSRILEKWRDVIE